MAKDRLADKLAVVLQADVAASTRLVQQDEQLARERIHFWRFIETLCIYHGRVRELRGGALLGEFERASQDVSATLAFQADHNIQLDDDIQSGLWAGIALGGVVIAENTITGAGVVLVQQVEQLAKGLSIVVRAISNRTRSNNQLKSPVDNGLRHA